MTKEEKQAINQLQNELNSSGFKCCTDCVKSDVVVYVTDSHVLISDKKHPKNQMIIPFSVFRQQYEDRLKALDNGDSKSE